MTRTKEVVFWGERLQRDVNNATASSGGGTSSGARQRQCDVNDDSSGTHFKVNQPLMESTMPAVQDWRTTPLHHVNKGLPIAQQT